MTVFGHSVGVSAKMGCLELEFYESRDVYLWNLSSGQMYEAGGSLERLDLKIWRNFEISCFSCVITFVLVVNVKGCV